MVISSVQLEDLKNYVKLARESAYFGKYTEAINTFKKAIESVTRFKTDATEPILAESWSQFEIDLISELEVISELLAVSQGFKPSANKYQQAPQQLQYPQQQQQQPSQQLNKQNNNQMEPVKKLPFGKAPFSHFYENNNNQPQQSPYQDNTKGYLQNQYYNNNQQNTPQKDYSSPIGPSSQPSGQQNNRIVGAGGQYSRNNNPNVNQYNNNDNPFENNVSQQQNNQNNFNVEFYSKPQQQRGQSNIPPPDAQQSNDPDVWPAPPPPSRKVNNKAQQAKNNQVYNLKDINNNQSAANNNNSNNNNNNGKRRGYDKPWQKNAEQPKKKGASNNGGDTDADGKKKSFLNFVYPDGNGPDSNLIAMLEREVVDTNPNISFDQIAELEKAKDMLQEAVLLPILIPSYFKGIRRPLKGAMMFGPPGTGKTMLAKAVATTGKTTFFNVSASSLASKWKGDSEKLVRILFEMARYYSPSTIFFDEIDAIGSKRGDGECESNRKMKAEMLIQIDGVNNSSTDEKDRKQVMVLAATNRPWDLDEALRRRLEKRILIPLPSTKGRSELFKLNMKGIIVSDEVDWDELVRRTDGYSGADIALICREAAFMPMRRKLDKEGGFRNIENIKNLESQSDIPLTQHDFNEAIKNVNKSVSKDDLENFEKWMNEFGSV